MFNERCLNFLFWKFSFDDHLGGINRFSCHFVFLSNAIECDFFVYTVSALFLHTQKKKIFSLQSFLMWIGMRLVHKIFYLSTLGERQTGATNLIKNENLYEIFLIFERSKNGYFVCPTDVKSK